MSSKNQLEPVSTGNSLVQNKKPIWTLFIVVALLNFFIFNIKHYIFNDIVNIYLYYLVLLIANGIVISYYIF